MSLEKEGRTFPRIETSHAGIFKEILMGKDVHEGILEINITTIPAGATVELHEHRTYTEVWHIIKGEGVATFVYADDEKEYKVFMQAGDGSVASFGDKHSITAMKNEDLEILVTKTPLREN